VLDKIKVEFTESGKPALWECGGGLSSTGNANIITGPDGEPLKPYYIQMHGDLANGNHALVPAIVGGCVIFARHYGGDFFVTIYRIDRIEGDYAYLTKINEFSQTEWDEELNEKFALAVDAAKRKAMAYHCRSPFYVAA